MLRITVLGAVVALRDALAAALTFQATRTRAEHHFSTQAGGDLILLLGLSRSDALPGSTASFKDQVIRSQLNAAHQPYQVLYGVLSEQLAQAARVISVHQRANLSNSPRNASAPTDVSNWRWACDKCSDPVCEHKLLTDLLARRKPQV